MPNLRPRSHPAVSRLALAAFGASLLGATLVLPELYRGDYHKASQTMEALRHVTMGELRMAADRYFRDIHFAYVGDTSRVRRELFTTF